MDRAAVRILVVDDEDHIQATFQRYLTLEGYDVAAAGDVKAGLAALDRRAAEILITDIKMPEIDGLELLKRVRQAHPETDVIVITGHATLGNAIEALRRGAFDYLTKPVDLEELHIVIERALMHREEAAALRETQAQLFQAQKMEALGMLAGGVAHEFNNLMGGIVGYADMALNSDRDELKQRALEVGLRAARRAGEVAKNLLHFARRQRYCRLLTDVSELLQDLLQLVRKDLEHDGIELDAELPPLPKTEVDQGQLQQVFLNLILNARQAMSTTPPDERRLRLGTGMENDEIIVEVADTGPGIPDETKQRVFEPFYSTRGLLAGGETVGATGLGLAVALGIVQAHEGAIEVEDVPGGGALMRVRLPMVSPTTRRQPRILVCDDEEPMRRVTRAALEREGFAVDEAEDGEVALRLVRETEYQLVLLDQNMPGTDGLTFLQQAKPRLAEVPVVMITAVRDEDLARAALWNGARECFFKPVNNERLAALARRYTGLAGGAEEACALGKTAAFTPDQESILVIDGDPLAREIYTLVLKKAGLRALAVGEIAQAADLTREHCFDLIVLETDGADIVGSDAVRALRANNPYTPLLLSTATGSSEILRAGLRVGASSVIEKPLNPRALLDQVLHLLALYSVPS